MKEFKDSNSEGEAVLETKLSQLKTSSDRQDYPLRGSMLFSIKDDLGALKKVLSVLADLSINMTRIESRPSNTSEWDYDFYVDFKSRDTSTIESIKDNLNQIDFVKQVHILGSSNSDTVTPWFPKRIRDLDEYSNRVLSFGAELATDHPGFTDSEYRQRRLDIAELAKSYRYGRPLPRVDYTASEIQTWRTVFCQLTHLYPTHACHEHRHVFPLLIENCGYREDAIPQLEDISNFLKDCTGFTLRPVSGLLSPRDFLNGLAFRVFHATQYIRHHSKPFYTPEPDVCHELLGHVPLFADKDFAEFSQEIGLASLGVSDDDIQKLATIYWFTVEYGLCREGDSLRAFGAGLLSSFGELTYCLSDEPKTVPFDPSVTSVTSYPITEYQPLYFVADSFQDAKEKVRRFAQSLDRPFLVYYNPLTQSVDFVDKKEKVLDMMTSIRGNVDMCMLALKKWGIKSD